MRALNRLTALILAGALLLGLGLFSGGCAGARATVTADSTRFPISFSQGVRDNTGRLWWGNQLIVVGSLVIDYTQWGLAYSFGNPGSPRDISKEVNAQVAKAGGEAVVNLAVYVRTRCDILNGFWLLNMLPFWPGCNPVMIRGDIVKRNPSLMGAHRPPLKLATGCRGNSPKGCQVALRVLKTARAKRSK